MVRLLLFVLTLLVATSSESRERRYRSRSSSKGHLRQKLMDPIQAYSYPDSCPDKSFCRRVGALCRTRRGYVGGPRSVVASCPCTCDIDLRAEKCCRDMGVRRHCLPLCSYRADLVEKFYELGAGCMEDLPRATYCLAQGRDSRKCCQSRGVQTGTPCMELCNGGKLGPFCNYGDLFALEQCSGDAYQQMIECFIDRMPQFPPRWDPNVDFSGLFCPEFNLTADLQALFGEQFGQINLRTLRGSFGGNSKETDDGLPIYDDEDKYYDDAHSISGHHTQPLSITFDTDGRK